MEKQPFQEAFLCNPPVFAVFEAWCFCNEVPSTVGGGSADPVPALWGWERGQGVPGTCPSPPPRDAPLADI